MSYIHKVEEELADLKDSFVGEVKPIEIRYLDMCLNEFKKEYIKLVDGIIDEYRNSEEYFSDDEISFAYKPNIADEWFVFLGKIKEHLALDLSEDRLQLNIEENQDVRTILIEDINDNQTKLYLVNNFLRIFSLKYPNDVIYDEHHR